MTSEEEVTAMIQRLSNDDATEHNLFRLSSSELSGGSPPTRSFHHLRHKPQGSDSGAPTHQALLNHSMLAPGFMKPPATLNELNHPQPHFMRQAAGALKPCNSSSHIASSRGSSPPATLSNTLFITADTDPYQAASMLVAILSQSSHPHGNSSPDAHAVLHITSDAAPHRSPHPSELQLEQLMAAARVVLHATAIANQELSSNQAQPCDMAFVPFMSPAAAAGGGASVSVLVITTGQRAAVFHGPGAVQILISSNNNLQLKSQEISAVVGSGAQADVFYDPADALLLLQTVLLSRWGLQGSGQDVLLLPVSVSQVKLVQVSHVLSAKSMQQLAGLVQLQEQPLGASPGGAAAALFPLLGQVEGGPRRVSAAELGMDGMAQKPAGAGQKLLQGGGKAGAAGRGSPPPPTAQDMFQASNMNNMIAAATAAAMASISSQQSNAGIPGPLSQQQQGGAAAGHSPPPPQQPQQQPQQQHGQGGGGGGSGQRSHQQRVRKADYVIVTEDTAIKNAAGAIAKVLGRVCEQGQCCPVYTERKTGQPTGVISVAVKAITVARGYVDNEGQHHQVAFQPYLRLQAAGGGGPALDPSRPAERRSPEAMLAAGGGGCCCPVLLRSVDNSASAPSAACLDDECSELAFDVFKVGPGMLPDVAEDSNVPVKVTAHSRANVVSNIITKLVLDHSSAVLITAGGPAMRVAMRAVVAARCRLQASRCASDILLVPQFVTVDTKNTHGWESVFLKFHIVRVPGSLLGSDPLHTAAAASAALAAAGAHPQHPLAYVHSPPPPAMEPLLRMSSGGHGHGHGQQRGHAGHGQYHGGGGGGGGGHMFSNRSCEPNIFTRASEPIVSTTHAMHSAHAFGRQSGPAALNVNMHPLHWMGGSFLPEQGWPGVN